MIETLDKVLLSENVVETFYEQYNIPTFKVWLNSILPEVERCRETKQDNPWHIYNCLDHILHSVEEINKLTTELDSNIRRLLAYTMFLHDIGKPECYIRRYSHLYGREVDSFFKHNEAGVKVAERVLGDFDFNENEQKIIKTFIDKHDIFMSIKLVDTHNKFHRVLSEELLEEEINELNNLGDGCTLLNYLIMIGTADNKAQNSKLTGDSLKLLDKMKTMLDEKITVENTTNNLN